MTDHDAVELGTEDEQSAEANLHEVRRVVVSSYLGNTIETYDFVLYGSAAALIFGPLFFSNLSPAVASIASFATFATGYIARPLGGVLFGYMGDRVGRKAVLLSTMTLMGLGSGAIGLLPTLDQIGMAAPVLLILLRLTQGLALGGEWGGGALMIAEHVSPRSRGFYSAIGQAGLASGAVLATLAMALVTQLPDEALFSWGWRVPFLASFSLLIVGIYMRLQVSESPLFLEAEAAGRTATTPLRDVATKHRWAALRGIASSVPVTMSSALFGSFALAYAVGAGFPRSTVLLALSVGWGLSIFTMPLYGLLSDRVGRRPVYLISAAVFAFTAYPFFWALDSGSVWAMFAAFTGTFAVVVVAMQGVLAALLSEMFPTESRSTGVSISYQCGAVIGGFSPMVAAALLAASGGANLIALLVVLVAVVAFVAVCLSPESRGSSLRGGVEPSPASPSVPSAEPAV